MSLISRTLESHSEPTEPEPVVVKGHMSWWGNEAVPGLEIRFSRGGVTLVMPYEKSEHNLLQFKDIKKWGSYYSVHDSSRDGQALCYFEIGPYAWVPPDVQRRLGKSSEPFGNAIIIVLHNREWVGIQRTVLALYDDLKLSWQRLNKSEERALKDIVQKKSSKKLVWAGMVETRQSVSLEPKEISSDHLTVFEETDCATMNREYYGRKYKRRREPSISRLYSQPASAARITSDQELPQTKPRPLDVYTCPRSDISRLPSRPRSESSSRDSLPSPRARSAYAGGERGAFAKKASHEHTEGQLCHPDKDVSPAFDSKCLISKSSSSSESIEDIENRQFFSNGLPRRKRPKVTNLPLVYPPDSEDAVTITGTDFARLDSDAFLNDTLVDFYLKYLQKNRAKCIHGNVYFFNSFFYKKLIEPGQPLMSSSGKTCAFERVCKWTKKIDPFAFDYLVVPINQSFHWSVIIICHPGHVMGNNTSPEGRRNQPESKRVQKPYMLHLDSMEGGHSSAEAHLRSYLCEEWLDRNARRASRATAEAAFKDLRALPVSVPQQDNYCDCGLFLLHYVELFLQEVSTGHVTEHDGLAPLFLKETWFKPAEASAKRTVIRNLIIDLSSTQSKVPGSPRECGSLNSPSSTDSIIISSSSPRKPLRAP